MLAPSAFIKGTIARFLPTSFIDDRDADKPVRLGRYGEFIVVSSVPTRHQLVEEGSYLLATNPTVSTGFTQVAAQTAFSDTAPNMYLYNPESSSNPAAKTIFPDYIKMVTTAASTAAASIHYALILDTVPRAITTDNTAAMTLVNPNGNSSPIITPTLRWQNSATVSVIAASSSSKRLVGRGTLGGLNVAGDELRIVFGSTDIGANAGLTATQATAVGSRVTHSPAIGVGPGQSLVLHLWAPSSSASWNPEVEFGMWAR